MNVTLPKRPKGQKRRIAKYICVIIICILAILVAVYQFFADEKLEVILGLAKTEDEKIETLKTEFDGIFTNQPNEFVYTEYEKKENSLNDYDLNVNIPYINIDNNEVKKHNEEMKKLFGNVAESILQTKGRNIVYSVNYMSEINNNILSVVIRSNIKEGNSAQRTIIQTYNYNIEKNEEVKLTDLLEYKNIEKNVAEDKIKEEIKKAQTQATELKNLGYNIYNRNATDAIYKLENTTEFFIYSDRIYIIYAYGNQEVTSEMDIIIL